MLIGEVLSAVHHAEVIAHKTGEPCGSLVLAICVTIIEVSLIISMMLTGHEDSQFITRDAVFATVMIVINGVIGLCIFIGGLTHHEMSFLDEGANSALAVLTALATFILVMLIVTISTPGPEFTKSAGFCRRCFFCSTCGFSVLPNSEPSRLLLTQNQG